MALHGASQCILHFSNQNHMLSHAFGSKAFEFIIGFVCCLLLFPCECVFQSIVVFAPSSSAAAASSALFDASSIYLFHTITTVEIFSLIGKWINAKWRETEKNAKIKSESLRHHVKNVSLIRSLTYALPFKCFALSHLSIALCLPYDFRFFFCSFFLSTFRFSGYSLYFFYSFA